MQPHLPDKLAKTVASYAAAQCITNRLPQCGYSTNASPQMTGWRPWIREPATSNSRTVGNRPNVMCHFLFRNLGIIMKRKGKSFIFLIMVALLSNLFDSCTKIDSSSHQTVNDFRLVYRGNFTFTIYDKIWWMDTDSIGYTIDTILTEGSIDLFRKNQLLIKFNSSNISGIWRNDTIICNGLMICRIVDSLINNPPRTIGNYYFTGYYDNWTTPVIQEDSILEFPCIPFRLTGGFHQAFGGYFINKDSLYLFYSDGGLGSGYYRYIYGKRY